MHFEIIDASVADLKELQTLSRKTFHESFASGNTEENMRQFLDTVFSEEKLKEEILNPDSKFYFARSHNSNIGYLKINFGKVQTELKEKNGMEIERIYALKEFHGKGVGQLLFDKALEIAKNKKMDYVWLGVWDKNPRAIRFYEKKGFVKFGSHPFKVGEDEQTDILMRKELSVIE